MPATTAELTELQRLLDASGTSINIEKAKVILTSLKKNTQAPTTLIPVSTSASQASNIDARLASVLEKLHETQEELIIYTMQNAMLLELLNECYEAMDKSVSVADQIVQANR